MIKTMNKMLGMEPLPARWNAKNGVLRWLCGVRDCPAMLATFYTEGHETGFLTLPDNFDRRGDGTYGQSRRAPSRLIGARELVVMCRELSDDMPEMKEMAREAKRRTDTLPRQFRDEDLPLRVICPRCRRCSIIRSVMGR